MMDVKCKVYTCNVYVVDIIVIMSYKHPIPSFRNIMTEYEEDDPRKTLRVGQWFFNKFIRNQPVSAPYNFDRLYNSTDFGEIFDILRLMYIDYQWPLN